MKKIDRFVEDFSRIEDTSSWFDKYHSHFDWDGYSSRVRHRRNHVRYYIEALRRMKKLNVKSPKPFQTYVFIDASDSIDDAIYLHTPNPNYSSEYPLNNPGIEWLNYVPKLIEGLVNLDEYEIGQIKLNEGEFAYFIKMIELGDSLK